MLRLLTIKQVRDIELEADANGYSYENMMDSAGRAIADRSVEVLDGITQPRITILVGKGNNGGDGLVAGLYIAQDNPNAEVRFYLLDERDDDYIATANTAGLFIANAEDDKDKRLLRNMVASADLVIDALFGIGVHLPIQEEAQKILQNTNREINARRQAQPEQLKINPTNPLQSATAPPIYVLAVDCPSGMNCDTGELDKNAIQADETVTFISAKRGQFIYPAADYVGDLTVADIGISKKLKSITAVTDFVIDSTWVKAVLPKRQTNGHKGTYGRALIIAGSINFVGAPALSAEAAYRSGAGLVTVGTPASVVMALAGNLKEVTWMMLPNDMGVISEGAVKTVLKDFEKMKALLLGPGLGTEKTTGTFITELLSVGNKNKKSNKRRLGFGTQLDEAESAEDEATITLPPLVVDADGLNLLAEVDNWWELLPENTIITPHPREMARLCGLNTTEVQENRWQLARDKAKEWNVIVVLKGAYTVIASPEQFAIVPFAVDALATAGTGDILAGLIVGLLAQGVSAFEAACSACYVHGLAGKIVSQDMSNRSVIASDVLKHIGTAFKQIDH